MSDKPLTDEERQRLSEHKPLKTDAQGCCDECGLPLRDYNRTVQELESWKRKYYKLACDPDGFLAETRAAALEEAAKRVEETARNNWHNHASSVILERAAAEIRKLKEQLCPPA